MGPPYPVHPRGRRRWSGALAPAGLQPDQLDAGRADHGRPGGLLPCAGRCSTQVLSALGSGCFAFSAACAPSPWERPLLPERPEHPLARVVIGTQLAEADLPSTFRQPRNYLVSFLRLALFPTLTALLLAPLRSSSGLYCALVPLSATPVAGMTSLFAQQFGRDTALRRSPSPCQPCSPSSPLCPLRCWPEGSACSNRRAQTRPPQMGAAAFLFCAKTSWPKRLKFRGAPVHMKFNT